MSDTCRHPAADRSSLPTGEGGSEEIEVVTDNAGQWPSSLYYVQSMQLTIDYSLHCRYEVI